eukprot:3177777-Pyramimonas_sp.AAC.1
MASIKQRVIYTQCQCWAQGHKDAEVFDPEAADKSIHTERLPAFLYKFAVRSEIQGTQRVRMNKLA